MLAAGTVVPEDIILVIIIGKKVPDCKPVSVTGVLVVTPVLISYELFPAGTTTNVLPVTCVTAPINTALGLLKTTLDANEDTMSTVVAKSG